MVFLLGIFALVGGEEKKDEMRESFTSYFAGIKKQYDYTRTWPSKRKIYKALLPELADLLKQNAGEMKSLGAYYYLGLSTGFLDLLSHNSFLEDELYEGEWIKSSGLLIKDQVPPVYNAIMALFRQASLEYYQLYVGHRQVAMEKLVVQSVDLLKRALNQKSLNDQQKILLSGYAASYLFFLSLNQYLDNKMELQTFVSQTLQAFRPGQ
jgi:hypothetical protein